MGSRSIKFKKTLLASSISAALLASSFSFAADEVQEEEELLVRGIRPSLQKSLDIKRASRQIVEVITADDVGKMPDQNIAESLQRLPGIQIDRRNGEGTKVRIRGLDQNQTLLNGGSFVSGLEYFQLGEWKQEYNNSLEGVPSELLGGVEVYKTPVASMIEGGMGGVINLTTRSGLDLKDRLVAVNLKADKGGVSSDMKPSGFAVFGENWGRFAAIGSVSFSQKTVHTDYMQSFSRENSSVRCTQGGTFFASEMGCFEDDAGAAGDVSGQSYLAPGMWYVMDTEQERERIGGSLNLEFQATDALELGFDWFHNSMKIESIQYTVKHPMGTDGATGVDEAAPYYIDSSEAVGVLRYGSVMTPAAETNTAGEVSDTSANNFAFTLDYDLDTFRISAAVNMASSELTQRGGYADNRFSEYKMRAYTGVGVDGAIVYDSNGDGMADAPSPTGWSGVTVNPSPVGGADRSYSYAAGSQPQLSYEYGAWLSDPRFHTYKSHWALGSEVTSDAFAFRIDIEKDLDMGHLKTIKFGIRAATDEVDFVEQRYLTDFSQTSGAQSPTLYNTDGSVRAATTFSPSTAPDATNAGVREALYYDLCGNGGIPSGAICDINGDGFDENQPSGPNGYFFDASIGLKAFNFTERFYELDFDGNPVANWDDSWGDIAQDENGDEIVTDTVEVRGVVVEGAAPVSRRYRERSLVQSLYGMDGDSVSDDRFGLSPGYLPWQTPTPQNTDARNVGGDGAIGDAARYIVKNDFFPSGGYSNNGVVFQDAKAIVADVGAWIDGLAPNSPVSLHNVALESWKVKESTSAAYVEADFEGDSLPYSLNLGVRVVVTDVDVTSAETTPESSRWSLATDDWNSQGVLLDWNTVVNTKSYTDVLPSLNFTLDLSDNTKLRYSAAKVISRPDLQALGKGFQKNYTREDDPDHGTYFQYTGGSSGNYDLDPYRASQMDIAIEQYFGDLGYVSGGFFYKKVDSFIAGSTVQVWGADDGPGGGRLGAVETNVNGEGGELSGFELAVSQAWDNGFGVNANYTNTEVSSSVSSDLNQKAGFPGVSETAYNIMGYFENEMISARLAYTWRDEFLSPDRSSFGVGEISASEYFDAYGQWDANVTWNATDSLSFTAEMINILSAENTSYLAYKNNPMTYASQERRVVLGVLWRL